MASELLEVGYVAGAHGVRGAVRIALFDPDSPVAAAGRTVVIVQGDSRREHAIASASPVPGQTGRVRVWLEGVDDRDSAEALKGAQVWVDREQLPALDDDEFYLADAVGLPVMRRRESGELQALGKMSGLSTNSAQDLFEVEWQDAKGRMQTWLMPVLPGFVVELDDERVVVDVPLGMLPEELENA